jgi:ABC-type amino acid transport system permease subunit
MSYAEARARLRRKRFRDILSHPVAHELFPPLLSQVIENLRGTPFVMALRVINIIGLAGFAFTLREVGNAIERRNAILKACIDRPR